MTSIKFILLVHVAATLFMVGAIWIVQAVHYALFDHVGRDVFAAYEQAHTMMITPIVGIPMLIELGTALLLLVDRPPTIPVLLPLVGLALIGVAWLSTMFIQVPLHNILSGGFDQNAYQALVNSNWIRTFAWSVRGIIVLWMVGVTLA
jgi:hypothetical protein